MEKGLVDHRVEMVVFFFFMMLTYLIKLRYKLLMCWFSFSCVCPINLGGCICNSVNDALKKVILNDFYGIKYLKNNLNISLNSTKPICRYKDTGKWLYMSDIFVVFFVCNWWFLCNQAQQNKMCHGILYLDWMLSFSQGFERMKRRIVQKEREI